MTALTPQFLKREMILQCVSETSELLTYQATDLFRLWARYESLTNSIADPPYWGVVWPAARVLSSYLLHHAEIVKERTVIDLGCGSGLCALAAARCGGSRVVANDIDNDALFVTMMNAEANALSIEVENRNRIEEGNVDGFSVVLLADGFYERTLSKKTIALLMAAQEKGATILIADGGRPFAPKPPLFRELFAMTVPVSKEVEGVRERHVVVGELVGAMEE